MGSFIIPVNIQENNLSSNVDLDSDADIYGAKWKGVWSASTSYAKEDVTRVGNELYESAVDSNSGSNPETTSTGESPPWVHLGKINKYRMFDEYVSSDTTNDQEVSVILTGLKVDQVAILGCEADNIKIEVQDGSGGTQYIYEEDIAYHRDPGSWYEFFFKPFPDKRELDRVFDLPWVTRPAAREQVLVQLTGHGLVKCGGCYFGTKEVLGFTQWDPEVGAMFFGVRKRDKWGRISRGAGETAKLAKAMLRIPGGYEDYTYKQLNRLLKTNAIFDLNNDNTESLDALVIYGFLSDFWEAFKFRGYTVVSMTLEGLI